MEHTIRAFQTAASDSHALTKQMHRLGQLVYLEAAARPPGQPPGPSVQKAFALLKCLFVPLLPPGRFAAASQNPQKAAPAIFS